MIKLICILLVIAFTACETKQAKKSAHVQPAVAKEALSNNKEDAQHAKDWLIKSVEYYFNTDDAEENKSKIFTKSYKEYKQDAINVDYDGMTLNEFEQKWKDRFNTKYAGIGTGFLISGQDYGKIKVTSCELSSAVADTPYFFKTIITDIEFKIDYKRDIKIVHSGNAFLIADILEYN